MTTSIDARDRDVQSAFEKARAIARGSTTATLHDVETSLWTALLALGRAMISLYLTRVAARPRATEYVHDGAKFVLAGSESSEIGTRFGKLTFERPIGRRIGWRRARCDRPVDRALGLCGGFSLSTVLSATRLCAQLAFTNARANVRAILRMVAEYTLDTSHGRRGRCRSATVSRRRASTRRRWRDPRHPGRRRRCATHRSRRAPAASAPAREALWTRSSPPTRSPALATTSPPRQR